MAPEHTPPVWRDIVDAADWLGDELGISRPLWGEACLNRVYFENRSFSSSGSR
jgi:hypothetical protein